MSEQTGEVVEGAVDVNTGDSTSPPLGGDLFEPTTFNPGAPPGISAAELNKLGQGIRDAQTAARTGARTISLLTMGA